VLEQHGGWRITGVLEEDRRPSPPGDAIITSMDMAVIAESITCLHDYLGRDVPADIARERLLRAAPGDAGAR
jgi:hypothetical protein